MAKYTLADFGQQFPDDDACLLAWRTARRHRKQLPKLKGGKQSPSIVPIHRRRGA